jgi:RsiW-degrading membrane proteinase PrsW (M82 family)
MSRFLYALVPPFALFGPLFIVQAIPGLPLWNLVFALVGGLMAGLAVLAVMLRQREIEARLDALYGGKSETA